MPRIASVNGPDLAIVLDKKTTFKGGETISGYVVRKSHIIDPNASIKISLYGRSKVKLGFSGGLSHRQYRICFNLFDGSREAYKIYQGPVQIPPSSPEQGRWPFVIYIPEHPDPAALRRNNEDQRSFLPLNDTSAHTIPPTFSLKVNAFGRWVNAWIEYHLEATLISSHKKQYRAIYPLYIWSTSPPQPITDFDIKRRSSITYRTATQRLVPGMRGAKLSLGQKIKEIFGSSQTPNYLFTLQQDFASILQLGNPNTIPLLLRATPCWNGTSEILQNVPQAIVVKHFTLNILATTHYSHKRLSNGEMSDTKTIILADYKRKPGLKKLVGSTAKSRETQGEMSPSTDTLIVPDDSSAPPLDLGATLGIRIPSASSGMDVYPTFTTYNLKNRHQLIWELILTVAGETVRCDGRQPVTVIGQSYGRNV